MWSDPWSISAHGGGAAARFDLPAEEPGLKSVVLLQEKNAGPILAAAHG
jgi:hypothetical protein